jgi:hypothetical protein
MPAEMSQGDLIQMQTLRRLRIAAVLCFLAAIQSPWSAVGAKPVVHAVIVGDTSPSAEWGKYVVNVTMDTTAMFAALTAGLPEAQCRIHPLLLEEDEWSTPEHVLRQLEEVSPQPEDTVLFYFSGHGGADDRGHYFRLAKGKLFRDDVRRAIGQKGARLNVLISDCCNVRSDGFAYFAPAIDDRSPTQPTPLCKSLLLDPVGWVDLNASSPGEAAFFKAPPPPNVDPFSDPSHLPGSLFTTALTNVFEKRRGLSLEWSELVRELSVDVHLAFRANYPRGATPAKGLPIQTAQHVYAIEYPGMPDRSGPRTGLIVRDYRGSGALIVRLSQGSPGTRVYDVARRRYTALRSGQIVVAANEHSVKSAADLMAATQKSPQLMRLLIQEADNRAPQEYLLALRY